MLGAILAAAELKLDDRCLLLTYEELPEAVPGRVLRELDIEYGPEELQRMIALARFDSKHPGIPFEANDEPPQPATRAAAERWAAAPFAGLATGARGTAGRAMLKAVRLPIEFDVGALADATETLAPDDWVPHFNTAYYSGDWSGVALRSVGGEDGRLYPDPTAQGLYAPTKILERSAALSAALARFQCPLLAARLLRLGPGARIREHTDYSLGYEDGEVRIHVPVTSGPDVEFMHDGSPLQMQPGEAWYLDLNLPHSVANRGESARVHLVVDCVVNDWLTGQLLSGPR